MSSSKSKLVKNLVKVIKRLSLNESNMRFRYDNFASTVSKVESPKVSFWDLVMFRKSDKQELSDYIETKYYQGKIMAYMYVLAQLVGQKKAERLLFKGIQGEKNIDKYGKKIPKKKE